jgi:hypothetical protein
MSESVCVRESQIVNCSIWQSTFHQSIPFFHIHIHDIEEFHPNCSCPPPSKEEDEEENGTDTDGTFLLVLIYFLSFVLTRRSLSFIICVISLFEINRLTPAVALRRKARAQVQEYTHVQEKIKNMQKTNDRCI